MQLERAITKGMERCCDNPPKRTRGDGLCYVNICFIAVYVALVASVLKVRLSIGLALMLRAMTAIMRRAENGTQITATCCRCK